MRTESELRAWLAETGPAPAGELDVSSIVGRSRRRRLPAQLAVGGFVTLAVAGIGVASVTGLRIFGGSAASTTASESAVDENGDRSNVDEPASQGGQEPSDASSGGIALAPAYKLNPCGGELAEVAVSASGLEASTRFSPAAANSSASVDGTVVMTNTGSQRVTGTTGGSPAITVSQNGVVAWHSNGPVAAIAVLVDLAPGESMEYPASFTPVRCEVEDDAAEQFRDALPPLAPGTYELSAAIDFVPDDGTGAPADLVTGPLAPIAIG